MQPAAPVITSALAVSGTINQPFSYQIAATNAPTSYATSTLPTGLNFNTTTGVIGGTPSGTGVSNVTLGATAAGVTGNATLVITINLIPQTISFPVQAPATRPYSQNGVVTITPAATGGTSGNAIVYSSATPSVCSVSAGSFTILSAGICTLAANQAGNATHAAAAPVTQSVAITGIAPAAPTIGTASAGNTQASISFTPPANTGGLPITGYTATCNGVTASGPGSPIVVGGLVNGVSYACSAQATNLAGTSVPSATVNVTPVAISFSNVAFSRKTHGGIDRDLPITLGLPLNGAVTVEPRLIGAGHQIVFVFNSAVTISGTAVATGLNLLPVGIASTAPQGNNVVVTLTGIADASRVLVTLSGVNGGVGAVAPIGFLVGDVTNNHAVNAADISAVKARAGPTTATNFMFDLNASGTISNVDVSAVKARAGLVIP